LAWAIGLGLTLRQASDTTRQALSDLSAAITRIVTLVIRLAPLGIFGLVAGTLAESGVQALLNYAQLLGVIVGCMLFVALVSNPLLVYLATRQNPYPLVFACLRGSAITAFSLAARRPTFRSTLKLCRRLDLDADTYAISIPLGATINMC
ncbi:serine/threonine protein kinase, partial [Halomonas sp. SUBG004]